MMHTDLRLFCSVTQRPLRLWCESTFNVNYEGKNKAT